MATVRRYRSKKSIGFTLIEVMITVAIVGILAAIALPSYSNYIQRGKIIDGTTKLGDMKSKMDKYFSDNRTYQNGAGTACGATPLPVTGADYFTITCVAPTATTYGLTATGIAAKGMPATFIYTVDQANVKTSAGPGGYFTATDCWAMRQDGTC